MLALTAMVTGPALAEAEYRMGMEATADSAIDTVHTLASTTMDAGANVMTEADVETGVSADVSVEVTTAAQVDSEEDLEVFVAHMQSENAQLRHVETESDADGDAEVEVTYEHQGKFLGLFPVTISSHTFVEAGDDIEVDSRLSWWGFLVTQKNYNEAEIESAIRSNTSVMVSSDTSAHMRAQLAETVVAEVAAHAQAYAQVK